MTKKERAVMAARALECIRGAMEALEYDDGDPNDGLLENAMDGLCSANNYLIAYAQRQREEP